MAKDINFIVDVEPEEADQLLGLIEAVLKEWYVARHDREEQMQEVIAAARSKVGVEGSGTP